ncbi:hypothetical protein IJ670_00140, partial [bacterium]|nr:hypothetical protein [bacterium]
SFVLEKMQTNPSYAIGGIIPELQTNARSDKSSKNFIAELDESDGTIVKYHTNYLVINNLEADHLDFYKNGLSDILKTFKTVVENSQNVFLNVDDFGVNELLKEIAIKPISYAIKKEADYTAKNIQFNDLNSSFDIYKKGKFLTSIELIIPGLHNVYNALAIVSVLDNLGYEPDLYSKFFKEFSGMSRRFQVVYDKNDIKIVDDYAHHPHEIQSTLSAVEKINRKKVVIFQPHRYTRLKALWREFLESFNSIDELYVLDTFSAGDKFDNNFNSEIFAQEISKKGVSALYVKGNMQEAAQKIAPDIKQGDIVLTLGAGDVTKVGGYLSDLFSK